MNKDVIYIEPEDDITDIISRIKSSKQKVVALVPPKKLGIMRSAVNIKLIAKTGKMKDKAVVVVTTDPSLVKLSALSGLPVAKTLSSRPMLPSEFTKRKKQEAEELAEKDLDMPAEDDSHAEEVIDDSPKKAKKDDMKLDSDDVEEDDDDAKKSKKKKDSKKVEKIPNFDKYRKWIIFGGIGVVAIVVFCVWAFIFAPFAKITVNMKTIASNISENVVLVTDVNKKSNKEGKFLLEQIKYEEERSVDFEATGKANRGEKAKGTINVLAQFDSNGNGGTVNLPAGSSVNIAGKIFTTTTALSVTWDGMAKNCSGTITTICNIQKEVEVVATESGASYNVAATTSGNIEAASFSFLNSSAMTGGTDKHVTVVDEKDIEEARKQLAASGEAKDKLLEQIGDSVVKIESSYKVDTQDPTSTPKKGEEVENGKKAKLTAKTIYTIYVVDKTAIDEFVKEHEKDNIAEHDKIYSTGTPFFERFLEGTDGTFTAKFKTTIKVGPELSETAVMEAAKGKKVGEVKALIKDISSNINDVSVDTSFPWVRWVPNDPNKIEIKITVEE